MPLDFPNAPSVNDLFTDGNTTWRWTGSVWDTVTSATGAQGATGPTGPTGPTGASGGFSSSQTVETLASSRGLSFEDSGKLLVNSTAVTVTVEQLAVGGQVDFLQGVSGQITFVAGPGVTLNSAGNRLKTAVIWSAATIKCIAANSYVLIGDLSA